ncbi:hypothetical protein ONZ51_g11058 [Trametes cubensis]|uniref:Uncharacterized protein n=1 Tax=Trametes cubensis TaxID=1111947 RepID=A0AAD7TIB2_9APHY|nr:hypothetical protein ONZ51_g11058 [Trametes cubensis]
MPALISPISSPTVTSIRSISSTKDANDIPLPTSNPIITSTPLNATATTLPIIDSTITHPATTITAKGPPAPHRPSILLAILLPIALLVLLAVIAILWRRSSRLRVMSTFTPRFGPRRSSSPTCDKLGQPIVFPPDCEREASNVFEDSAAPRLALSLHREEINRISYREQCFAGTFDPCSTGAADDDVPTATLRSHDLSPSVTLDRAAMPLPLSATGARDTSNATHRCNGRVESQDTSLLAGTDTDKGGKTIESTIFTPLIPPTPTFSHFPGVTASRHASDPASLRIDSWNGTQPSVTWSSVDIEYGLTSSATNDSTAPARDSGDSRVLVLPWMVGQRLLEIAARDSMTTGVEEKNTEPPPPYHFSPKTNQS